MNYPVQLIARFDIKQKLLIVKIWKPDHNHNPDFEENTNTGQQNTEHDDDDSSDTVNTVHPCTASTSRLASSSSGSGSNVNVDGESERNILHNNKKSLLHSIQRMPSDETINVNNNLSDNNTSIATTAIIVDQLLSESDDDVSQQQFYSLCNNLELLEDDSSTEESLTNLQTVNTPQYWNLIQIDSEKARGRPKAKKRPPVGSQHLNPIRNVFTRNDIDTIISTDTEKSSNQELVVDMNPPTTADSTIIIPATTEPFSYEDTLTVEENPISKIDLCHNISFSTGITAINLLNAETQELVVDINPPTTDDTTTIIPATTEPFSDEDTPTVEENPISKIDLCHNISFSTGITAINLLNAETQELVVDINPPTTDDTTTIIPATTEPFSDEDTPTVEKNPISKIDLCHNIPFSTGPTTINLSNAKTQELVVGMNPPTTTVTIISVASEPSSEEDTTTVEENPISKTDISLNNIPSSAATTAINLSNTETQELIAGMNISNTATTTTIISTATETPNDEDTPTTKDNPISKPDISHNIPSNATTTAINLSNTETQELIAGMNLSNTATTTTIISTATETPNDEDTPTTKDNPISKPDISHNMPSDAATSVVNVSSTTDATDVEKDSKELEKLMSHLISENLVVSVINKSKKITKIDLAEHIKNLSDAVPYALERFINLQDYFETDAYKDLINAVKKKK
ncbi:mucin-2-like [Microplitis mediator]|uniref:mucin-2-like n=1 Tax=Microplitis mediator TaxID=375433 RepID=UPI002556C4CB|nr:mucin-2-like [Microplitis mediator]